jgi:hypothetical protein
MRPEFDLTFADCTKALDGWFGMVRALRISLCEEMESSGFLSALAPSRLRICARFVCACSFALSPLRNSLQLGLGFSGASYTCSSHATTNSE